MAHHSILRWLIIGLMHLTMFVNANRLLGQDTEGRNSLLNLNSEDNLNGTSGLSEDYFYDSDNETMKTFYNDWLEQSSHLDFLNGTELNDTSFYDNETVLFTFITSQQSLRFTSVRDVPYDLPNEVHNLGYKVDIYRALESLTQSSEAIDLVLPILALSSFCPSSFSCNVKTHGNGYEENFCCMHCTECEVNCESKGTCCLDIFSYIYDIKSCQDSTIGDSTMRSGSFSIMMYSICRIHGDPDIARKCHKRNSFNDFDELIPVLFNDNVYKNIYCILCYSPGNDNGQQLITNQQIKQLEIRLICKNPTLWIKVLHDILDNPGNTIDKLLNMNGCFVQWHTDHMVQKCIDSDNAIQECHDPSFDNIQIKRLCKLFSAPVKGKMGMYLNMYCLICNEGYHLYNESCKTKIEDVHESLYDIREDRYRVMLRLPQTIVDVISKNYHINAEGQQTSSKNEALDVERICSITSLDIGSQCVTVINDMMGIGFDYIFKIVHSNQMKISNNQIFDIVRPLISDGIEAPNICVEHVLYRHEEGNNTIVVVQLTKMNNKLANLQAEYVSLKNRTEYEFKVPSYYSNSLTVEIYQTHLELIEDGPVSIAVYSNVSVAKECGRAVAMTNLQFCETCVMEDVIRLNDTAIMANDRTYLAGEFLPNPGTKTVLVCCELYIEKMEKLADGLTGSFNAAVPLSIGIHLSMVLTVLFWDMMVTG